MPVKFDNSISWMDVGTLLSAGVFVTGAFFALEGNIIATSERVDRNTLDIQQVRANQRDATNELMRLMERNRVEAKADNQRLDAKLDKILDRVMEQ